MLESRTIRALGQSRDGIEGVKAFMEKRKPAFEGTLGEDLPEWVPWVSAGVDLDLEEKLIDGILVERGQRHSP